MRKPTIFNHWHTSESFNFISNFKILFFKLINLNIDTIIGKVARGVLKQKVLNLISNLNPASHIKLIEVETFETLV